MKESPFFNAQKSMSSQILCCLSLGTNTRNFHKKNFSYVNGQRFGQWSFFGTSSETKWYSMEENSTQGIWDHIAEKDAGGIR